MARTGSGNLLALAVLSLLKERPMHPYEISTVMRSRGLSHSIKLNYGSLYATMDALLGRGVVAVRGTEREGSLPERTVYGLTAAGESELLETLQSLISTPVKEYPRFVAGLAFLAHLTPHQALELFELRVQAVKALMESERNAYLQARSQGVDDLFLLELDFEQSRMQAELDWLGKTAGRISGTLAEGSPGQLRWKALKEGNDTSRLIP